MNNEKNYKIGDIIIYKNNEGIIMGINNETLYILFNDSLNTEAIPLTHNKLIKKTNTELSNNINKRKVDKILEIGDIITYETYGIGKIINYTKYTYYVHFYEINQYHEVSKETIIKQNQANYNKIGYKIYKKNNNENEWMPYIKNELNENPYKYEYGDEVIHDEYGKGIVLENYSQNIHVDFYDSKEKKILPKYNTTLYKIPNTYNIRCLNLFENMIAFQKYCKNLYNVESWSIQTDNYYERAKKCQTFKAFTTIKKLYQEKFKNDKCDEQIISILDSMCLLHWIIRQIKSETILNETYILIEYELPIKNKHRIDYLLSFRDKIIILEFSKTNEIMEMSNKSHEKQQQANNYMADLKNILNKNIEIYAYSFIYLPDDYMSSYEVNFEINKQNVIETAEFITRKFTEEKNAFEQILNISLKEQ